MVSKNNNLIKSKDTLINTASYSPTITNRKSNSTSIQAIGIVDSGDTDIYFSADAPMVNIDRAAPKVTIGTATGQTQLSTVTGEINLPKLHANFPVTGHIMPGFRHTLIDVGPLCDADCTVIFTSAAVIVRDLHGNPVLTGW